MYFVLIVKIRMTFLPVLIIGVITAIIDNKSSLNHHYHHYHIIGDFITTQRCDHITRGWIGIKAVPTNSIMMSDTWWRVTQWSCLRNNRQHSGTSVWIRLCVDASALTRSWNVILIYLIVQGVWQIMSCMSIPHGLNNKQVLSSTDFYSCHFTVMESVDHPLLLSLVHCVVC